ncbi:MAG: hypothetical protein R3C26_10770 [Calditrichia bacterium]
MVEVRIDMPATQEGIDVHPRSEKPVDFDDYSARIKKHGVALFVGDQIMITKVKLKGKHLEFQLGGGGYGTFWDDTGDVSPIYADKTEREKNLEKAVKKEKDAKKKKNWKKNWTICAANASGKTPARKQKRKKQHCANARKFVIKRPNPVLVSISGWIAICEMRKKHPRLL